MPNGLPPATAYHNTPMRLFNRAMRLLWQVGIGKASLSERDLVAAARQASGLEFFGDTSFVENLRRLLHGLETEAELNPLGRLLARQSLVRLLKHRLLAEDLWQRHPEILARRLAPPLIVVGLARSGTTRLHRLLACDPALHSIKAWESVNPVPLPESFGAVRDPRMTSIEQALKVVLWMSPQIESVHPLGAHEVEEEVGLIQHAFSSQLFEVMNKVPSFGAWLAENDQTHAYAYMVRLLKTIAWFRGTPEDAVWVLKTPQHMQDLDALVNVFPDARYLFIHRDPQKSVGSACSMVWNGIVRDTDHVDPHWIGREWLGKTEAMLKKTLRVRERIPAAQQLDVLYEDMNRDIFGVMQRICDWRGVPFTDSTRRGMEAWLAANAQHKHGAHHYTLEDFGLNSAGVEERLSFYRERFGIPFEGRAKDS